MTGSVHQDGAMGSGKPNPPIPEEQLQGIAERLFHIVERDGKWCLLSKTDGSTLGCHDSKEGAEAQERAIQANKHSLSAITVNQMREICPPCADKMEARGIRAFFLDPEKPDLGLEGIQDSVVEKIKQFALGETHNIKGVPIFSVGVWNGDKYSEKDLKEIADNFKATKDYLKPYLKLGHSEEQSLLAEDSLPAAGWIKNVYTKSVDGVTQLYADFVDMPQKIYDLVKAGAYARVSSEIFMNIKVNGKKYGKALKAVALLGGETPAVQNLDDVYALYSVEPSVLAYANEAEVRSYSFDSAQPKEAIMPLPQPQHPGAVPPHGAPQAGAPAPMPHAVPPPPPAPNEPDGDECYKQLAQAKLELDSMRQKMAAIEPKQKAMEQEVAGYKTSNQALALELEGTKRTLAEAKSSLEKVFAEQRSKEVKGRIEKLVNEKKIVPSQGPMLEAILLHALESNVKKFKLGDKEVELEALVMQFVESGQGSGLPTTPKTENGAPSVVNPEDGKSVHEAVLKYMTDHKGVGYTPAYKEVMKGLIDPKK